MTARPHADRSEIQKTSEKYWGRKLADSEIAQMDRGVGVLKEVAGGEKGRSKTPAKGNTQSIFDYLATGTHRANGSYNRLDNMKRAAKDFFVKSGQLFLKKDGKEPIRVCVTQEKKDLALAQAHDEDCSGERGAQKT